MAILKDPDESDNQLSKLEYQEIFSDINSPGIFIAQTEQDLTPKILVLDGHSTILVFNQADEDLPWQAFNELGKYKYQADQLGDGIVIFPHKFYFEFSVELVSTELDFSGSFDGTGINAIALPFKDVSITNFVDILKERISSTVMSVLKQVEDSLEINLGKNINLNEKSQSDISLKLALLGLNLEKITVLSTTTMEKTDTEMVEKIYDKPPKQMKTKLDQEEKEMKKKRSRAPTIPDQPVKAKPKMKKEVAIADEVLSQPVPAATAKQPPSAPPKAQPSTMPSPPPPAAPGGGPPATPSPEPVASEAAPIEREESMPEPAPIAGMESAGELATRSMAIEEDIDELLEEEMDEFMDDAGAMDDIEDFDEPSTQVVRYTHASYFERMVPNDFKTRNAGQEISNFTVLRGEIK
ncbi:MAG: hypothetical protein ACW98K_00360 [Candidatus Kariarchaeaceae archaeon]